MNKTIPEIIEQHLETIEKLKEELAEESSLSKEAFQAKVEKAKLINNLKDQVKKLRQQI